LSVGSKLLPNFVWLVAFATDRRATITRQLDENAHGGMNRGANGGWTKIAPTYRALILAGAGRLCPF
jgi:hypothetical protein